MMNLPPEEEYAPYYRPYISLVGPEGPLKELESLMTSTPALMLGLPEEWGNFRYAEGKWSIKEVLNHVIDAERIFAYRALCFARGEKQPLPGFEENEYVPMATCESRSIADLVGEYQTLRASNLCLFRSFSPEAMLRTGIMADNPASVRAIIYMVAGHELHHIEILKSRYLPAITEKKS